MRIKSLLAAMTVSALVIAVAASSASALVTVAPSAPSSSGAQPAAAVNECSMNASNFYNKTGTVLGVSQYKIATQGYIQCPFPVTIWANEQLTNPITGSNLDGGASNAYVCGSYCATSVTTSNSYQAAYGYKWHIGYVMTITDPANWAWIPGVYQNCTVDSNVTAHCDVTSGVIFVPNSASLSN
jgi:hypothetical protein